MKEKLKLLCGGWNWLDHFLKLRRAYFKACSNRRSRARDSHEKKTPVKHVWHVIREDKSTWTETFSKFWQPHRTQDPFYTQTTVLRKQSASRWGESLWHQDNYLHRINMEHTGLRWQQGCAITETEKLAGQRIPQPVNSVSTALRGRLAPSVSSCTRMSFYQSR